MHIIMLSDFLYGRTQHIRHIRSSTISVIHCFHEVFYMSCDVREHYLFLFSAKVKRISGRFDK